MARPKSEQPIEESWFWIILIKVDHPYLATKINEAKDLLESNAKNWNPKPWVIGDTAESFRIYLLCTVSEPIIFIVIIKNLFLRISNTDFKFI